MAGSYTKTIIIGNVGNDPEIKTMQSGDRVANLSIATSKSWKVKSTGERKERTEWHRVVCFNQPLVNLIENYVKKGSKILVEGENETRSWEQDGQKKYVTEVVMRPFESTITLLDSKGASSDIPQHQNPLNDPHPNLDEMEDEIPF